MEESPQPINLGQLLVLPVFLLTLPFIMLAQLLAQLPAGLPSLGGSSYSNKESWEIIRGPDGRIQSITIDRNATQR